MVSLLLFPIKAVVSAFKHTSYEDKNLVKRVFGQSDAVFRLRRGGQGGRRIIDTSAARLNSRDSARREKLECCQC